MRSLHSRSSPPSMALMYSRILAVAKAWMGPSFINWVWQGSEEQFGTERRRGILAVGSYYSEVAAGVLLNALYEPPVEVPIVSKSLNLLWREVLLVIDGDFLQHLPTTKLDLNLAPWRRYPRWGADDVVELFHICLLALTVCFLVMGRGGRTRGDRGLTWLNCWQHLDTRGPVADHRHSLVGVVKFFGPSRRV